MEDVPEGMEVIRPVGADAADSLTAVARAAAGRGRTLRALGSLLGVAEALWARAAAGAGVPVATEAELGPDGLARPS